MPRPLTIIIAILIICFILATVGGLVWVNMRYVHAHPLEKDFLIPWLGARTFLEYGDSPYGESATQRAQIVYYGRLATAEQDPLNLWLPFPVELFYFPFALVPDYVLARSIWMTCLEIALLASGYLSLQLTGWKPWRIFLPLLLVFPLFWVYGMISLTSGNPTGFIVLALVSILLALRDRLDELAGGLLILLSFAARTTGVLTIFVLWWIISQRRWRVLWGFLMGFAVLLGISFLLLPGWFVPFVRGLLSHLTNISDFSSTRIFASWSPVAGLRLGWLLAVILILELIFEWRHCLKGNYRTFLWTVSLSLSVTPLLGIPMVPKECPYLFVPLFIFLAIQAERQYWLMQWGAAGIMLVFILAGLWLIKYTMEKANTFVALNELLLLLLPALLVIGLNWSRWWFLHKIPVGLEKPKWFGKN